MRLEERIKRLQQNLAQENPVLLDVVTTYRRLDKIAQSMGVLPTNASYVEQISWWPLITVLGTFSAGKSSFINSFVGRRVQDTGNQAVDDRFSVICYGSGDQVMALPGLALDADPRFPFYGIRHEIERISEGEGDRIDTYLQLKTVPEDVLKGRIIIDSPGFDADSQRDTVLRVTDHIIGMSDLVLVFFDARHPEPGAMRDTLKHLVESTVKRRDADKFLFILNQIDTAANEDNPEEIMGSWQRSLAASGLIGGKFYMTYNEKVATPISDPVRAERFKRKKDIDLAEIYQRMDKVSVERAYRISFNLETLSDDLEQNWLPKIDQLRRQWAKRVMLSDVFLLLATAVALIAVWLQTSWLNNVDFQQLNNTNVATTTIVVVVLLLLIPHYFFRRFWKKRMIAKLARQGDETSLTLARALARNTVFWRPLFAQHPRGWGAGVRKRLANIRSTAKQAIQKLNDQFAKPDGEPRSS